MTSHLSKTSRAAWACSALILSLLSPGSVLAQSFMRGDCNDDGSIARGSLCEISDSIFLLGYLFAGGPAPPCLEACNLNDDESLDIADAVHGLLHCFLGGPKPPAPFPGCGDDPTPSLDCGSFRSCSGCGPQDARGVGPCDAIVGIFWDGYRCRYHSGCSCEGKDCDRGYGSLEDCYDDHAGCPSVCAPMDAYGQGECRLVLGYAWDGYRCRAVTGCECVGRDCDRLYADPAECEAAVLGCRTICRPMDARGAGPCAAVLGYYWDGFGCAALSGCDCEGADCGKIYDSSGDCRIARQACPPACAPMDARGVGMCKKILGYAWDGRSCQAVVGCTCEGRDCDRLVSLEACERAHERCPEPCVPMDARGVGDCEMVMGFSYDGRACQALVGCECAGADCDRLLESLEECLLLNAECGSDPGG